MSDWIDVNTEATLKSRLTDYLTRGGQIPHIFAAIGVMHPQIEAVAKYIYLTEDINQAAGRELERFGEYAGITRKGMNDDAYRQAILSSRQRQSFSGAPNDLMQIIESQTGTKRVIVTERKSAAVNLHVSDNATIAPTLTAYMDAASVAGVKTTVTFGRGQQSFFLAGVRQVQYALGLSNGTYLATSERKAIGISGAKPFAFDNLSGLLVTPNLLAVNDSNVLGVNGKALALRKYSSKSAIANDGTRLAGCYI